MPDSHPPSSCLPLDSAQRASRLTRMALAIALNYYNNYATIDVDRAEELKG